MAKQTGDEIKADVAKCFPQMTEKAKRDRAKELGVTLRSMRRWWSESQKPGVKRKRGNWKGNFRRPEVDTNEAVELLQAGLNYTAIAEKLHTSRALIMYRLKRVAGLHLVPKIDPKLSTKLPWSEIVSMYESKRMSREEIIAALSEQGFTVAVNTIYRGLRARIQMRDKTAHMTALWAERNRMLREYKAEHVPPRRGRKRKDDLAAKVIKLKKTMSWGELTIKLNKETNDPRDEKSKEGYRSLFRARKKAAGGG